MEVQKSEAVQRHHDYYVGQWRKKALPIEEYPNLLLAKQREKSGEVKPLPGGRLESLRFLVITLNHRLTQLLHGPESLLPKQQIGENNPDTPKEETKVQ